jgi:Predicted outer membrane protein
LEIKKLNSNTYEDTYKLGVFFDFKIRGGSMSEVFKKKYVKYLALFLAVLQMISNPISISAEYSETNNEILSEIEILIETDTINDFDLESEFITETETQEAFVAESEVREYQEMVESQLNETEEETAIESPVESEIESEEMKDEKYYGSIDLNGYLARVGRNRATTSGSTGTISTPGDVRIYYNDGIHYTYAFQVVTDGGTFTGHCSEPYKMAPRGDFPVFEITDENIKYTIMNLLFLAPDGPLWNSELCRNLFFGGNYGDVNTGYLNVHYVLGYLTGMTAYMSPAEIQWAHDVVVALVEFANNGMIEGQMGAIGDSRWNYSAYIAQTGESFQNIVWLEKKSEPPTGSLELRKSSSRPEITNGNASYSLAGAVYEVFDLTTKQVLATITLDSTGYGRTDNLPIGKYGVREKTAPKGYHLNKHEDQITIEKDKTTTLNVYNEPVDDPIAILLQKVDSRTNIPIEGVEFTIKYYDVQMGTDPAEAGHTALKTWVLKTNKDGYASLNERYLVSGDSFYRNNLNQITIPLGTITLQETKTLEQYIINDELFVRQIIQGERPDMVVTYNAPIVPNTPFSAKISLQKTDSRTNEVLSGAEFKIQEWSAAQNKYVDSSYSFTFNIATKTYESNDLFYSVDNQGKFNIVETKNPNGYTGIWTQEFTITSNNEIFEFTAENDPFNGKIYVNKIDDETREPLKGAEFKIYVWSEAENSYKETNEVMTYNNATDRYESATLYYTPDNLGKYKIVETKNPIGFFGDWEHEITLSNVDQGFGLTAENKPIRGDVEIIKFRTSKNESETYIGLEGVEFTFANKETGEVVAIITTDKNGFATTASPLFPRGRLRYGTYIVTETVVPEGMKAITPFEVVISEEGQVLQGIYKENIPYAASVQLVKIDAETGNVIPFAGTTFQILDENKNVIEMTQIYPELKILTEFKTNENGWCLLPEKLEYGTYYVRELQAPESYLRGEDLKFVVDKDYSWENPLVIKIANAPVKGKLNITKVDAETKEKLAGAVFNIRAKNDVYTADGTLRVSKDEIVDILITDINGYAQSKELYLSEYYAEEIESPFGYGLNLKKHEFELVYENQETALVYASVEVENFHSKIKTSAFDQFTGKKEGFAKEMTTLIDIVSYTDLIVGKEYVIDGFLMDFDINNFFLVDGKKVTAQAIFVPTSPNGEIKLEFVFDGSALAGKTIVVFETLSKDGKEVYVHHDINDKEQTVEYKAPKIGTTASDVATDSNTGMIRELVTIRDIVAFENLIIGKEYQVKGILMEPDTGLPFLDNGEIVTSEITFIAEQENGTVALEFLVNGNSLRGKTVVVFETLYYEELEIAVHQDLYDKKQTVTFPNPQIGTTATNKTGGKTLAYGKKETIIDLVSYDGLTPGKEYDLHGILMDKSTGKPLLIDGKEVISKLTFIPETSSGTVEIAFSIDTTNLAGKEIVVFETLYHDEFEIAVHHDINDEGQTVTVENKGRIISNPPNTGDNSQILGIAIMIVVSAGVIITSVLKKRKIRYENK